METLLTVLGRRAIRSCLCELERWRRKFLWACWKFVMGAVPIRVAKNKMKRTDWIVLFESKENVRNRKCLFVLFVSQREKSKSDGKPLFYCREKLIRTEKNESEKRSVDVCFFRLIGINRGHFKSDQRRNLILFVDQSRSNFLFANLFFPSNYSRILTKKNFRFN